MYKRQAYVYGYESNYNKDPLCCSYAKGFYVVDKKYIRNTVKENGKNFASIVGQFKEDECCLLYTSRCV